MTSSLSTPTNPAPGDSKNTVDKLTDTATSIGTNIKETGEHYANKTGATDASNKVGDVGQNVKETVEHEANKANQSSAGEKTYLEQAQDLAASALNTASKTASGQYPSKYFD